MSDTQEFLGPRVDVMDIAKTLGIPTEGMKLAYLEAALNAEWWRGHRAGLLKAQDALAAVKKTP